MTAKLTKLQEQQKTAYAASVAAEQQHAQATGRADAADKDED